MSYVWRYIPGAGEKHALADPDEGGAVCNVYILPAHLWRGGNGRFEQERLNALPPCGRCARILGLECDG